MREKILIILITLVTDGCMFYKFSIYLKNIQLARQNLQQTFFELINQTIKLHKTFENINNTISVYPSPSPSFILSVIAFVIITNFFLYFKDMIPASNFSGEDFL